MNTTVTAGFTQTHTHQVLFKRSLPTLNSSSPEADAESVLSDQRETEAVGRERPAPDMGSPSSLRHDAQSWLFT